MAVGTSIGGIAVLGLFVNRWDFDTCKWKLSKLTAEILPRRPSTHPVKGRVESMLRYIKYAACIALQRSFVSGGTIQAVLRQEFGRYGSMMFPTALAGAPVKLAVTAWDTRAKCCSIVTSYNRPRLQGSKSYRWLQSNDADIDDQVWEAAQCTSAVPFLFPAAQLPGGPLVDGAVTCNNPTRIALQEAKIFWAPEEERNMVLSVGYGAMKTGQTYQDGPVAACRASIVESLSAEKQHTDLVLCGHQYVRLNPTLDIDAVQFDDVSSISRLQDSFRSTLAQDVAFAENVRATSFQLLASLFYVEIEQSSVLHDGAEGYSASAMIKPRIAV
ncbi:hypothetical protein E8E12_000283 [Didymella heteroderae]|uniref:PNPLA domain-containing protein n=1 Tax=Didymella heteroderae TaxID=1769908 RepID=A0A9P4WFG5_9PLEO|nr:hypothetical protein E8E12_000283 [Didymella heteroderae]